MGQPATGGSAEAAGWSEPDDCRAHASDRAGSGEISGSAAVENPPGLGSLTALAFVLIKLIIGRADRFQCSKQIASYLGLVPLEDSSGNRRRLGHITKQGNARPRLPPKCARTGFHSPEISGASPAASGDLAIIRNMLAAFSARHFGADRG